MAADGLAETARLMASVFPGSRVADVDYLAWLYLDSPFGKVIESNLDDEKGRAAHYAVVPITLSVDGAARPGALSLNTAVHERARGGGVFTRLATETYEQAKRLGIETILGVANANSTPGFTRRLGFDLLGQLPARVMPALPSRRRARFRSARVEAGADQLIDEATELLAPPATGVARSWNRDTLLWRLRSPGCRYDVHLGEEALAVSTAERRGAARVAVILKVFARHELRPSDLRALYWSVASWHRAPFVLHVGLNDCVAPSGIALPQRFRPSPLNLIRRELKADPTRAPITRLEFLDFDAY